MCVNLVYVSNKYCCTYFSAPQISVLCCECVLQLYSNQAMSEPLPRRSLFIGRARLGLPGGTPCVFTDVMVM